MEVYLPFLTKTINQRITAINFPEQLKKLEALPLHIKKDPLKKDIYRTMSLLPHVSKDFERILYKQINVCMQDIISKHITGFRKSNRTKHSFITMLDKWKTTLAKGQNICFIYGSPQRL